MMQYFSGPLHLVPGIPSVRGPAGQVLAASHEVGIYHEPVPRARIPAEHRLQADYQDGQRPGQGPGKLFSSAASVISRRLKVQRQRTNYPISDLKYCQCKLLSFVT